MVQAKKILLVTCTNGSGHIRAAEAIGQYCQEYYPEKIVDFVNLADYLNLPARLSIVSSYNTVISHAPWLFGALYRLTDNWFTLQFFHIFGFLFRMGAKKFIKKITEFQPDCIITTHFLPQLLLTKKYRIPIYIVATDYHVHHIWASGNRTGLFVPAEKSKSELAQKGISSDVSGFPLKKQFFETRDPVALKQQFGIEPNRPVVLVMPVMKGKIQTKEALEAIFKALPEAIVVAICGRANKKMLAQVEKIKNSGQKNFIAINYTDDVPEWMSVADVIVSKAGGSTISEAICMHKPLVIINPISGQEDYNAVWLEEQGYGLSANKADVMAEKIKLILNNPAMIKKSPAINASEIILNKIFTDQ
jgi:processive 1,2-diacylglycerol beta-glucosyltransferase